MPESVFAFDGFGAGSRIPASSTSATVWLYWYRYTFDLDAYEAPLTDAPIKIRISLKCEYPVSSPLFGFRILPLHLLALSFGILVNATMSSCVDTKGEVPFHILEPKVDRA